MKILKEASSGVAWMIRNDGAAFAVVQHLYANKDDVEETLYAAEWLYDHTNHSETRKLILSLIRKWAQDELGSELNFEGVIKSIEKRPYSFLSTHFVEIHWKDICEASDSNKNIAQMCEDVETELNQEFLRARYGGMYNSNTSSRELVFRISSTAFNWYNIIWEFSYKNKYRANSVTIVRDEESTGSSSYYKAPSGRDYNKLPIEDFITESGNPVIESYLMTIHSSKYTGSLRSICECLQKGTSIQGLEKLPMNSVRAANGYTRLRYDENNRNDCLSHNSYS